METILFWIFAIVAVTAALVVVLARNPITSALALIVTFFILAGYYILLSAQFLAAVQVVVYAGAIMVLFLFVIMLLNLRKLPEMFPVKGISLMVGIIVGGVLFLLVLKALTTANISTASAKVDVDMGSASNLGSKLFTSYLLPFEIASILLLSAIVGAVVLIKRPSDSDDK